MADCAALQALESGRVVNLGASVPTQHVAPTPLGAAQERKAQSGREARDVAMRVAVAKIRARLFTRPARVMGVAVEAERAAQDDPADTLDAALEGHVSVKKPLASRSAVSGFMLTPNWLSSSLLTL